MTDQEVDHLANFVKQIPEQNRAVFLETLGRRLATSGDFGSNVVSRALLAAQRDVVGPRLGITFLVR